MNKEIQESDMIFRFPEEVLFHIEESEAYKNAKHNMHMSEFIIKKKINVLSLWRQKNLRLIQIQIK